MAKHDWVSLQAAFLADNAETGITAQQWCEEHGLNYQSARRYIKPRAAQSAQKTVRNTARSAQPGQSAQKRAKRNKTTVNDEDVATDASDDATEGSGSSSDRHGRDRSGRFTAGNPGNTGIPSNAFAPRNTYSRKHGAYAKYLHADDLFEAAAGAGLDDELVFTRARALSVTRTLSKIHDDLIAAESIASRIELYDKMLKAEAALDRLTGRIESLEGTLSRLELDAVSVPRLVADTLRIKAATAKLKAETEKLTSENQGVTTPMDEVMGVLWSMGNDGVMS